MASARTWRRRHVNRVHIVALLVGFVSRHHCAAWISNRHRPSSRTGGTSSVVNSFFRCYSSTTATSQTGSGHETSTDAYRELYPSSVAHTNGTLQVDDVHTLYYEIHGQGSLDALFLHGGPGVGCSPNHARFFDLNRYRVVLLDQRGSGKSTPRASVVNNTLPNLVDDCERLRVHLGISSWHVVLGGSWGTTLALGYGQAYPSSIQSMILRGICTLRPVEVDWLFSANGGAARRLPEAWKEASEAVRVSADAEYGRAALHAYYDMFMSEDNAVRLAAAQSWMKWEFTVTGSYRNQQPEQDWNSTVLVSSSSSSIKESGDTWHFENYQGLRIMSRLNESPAQVVSRLLQFKDDESLGSPQKEWLRPRPVRKVEPLVPLTVTRDTVNTTTANTSRGGIPPHYIPAMAMLTCYYSVNDRYVLGGEFLLDPQRMQRLSEIPCIAVQGGMDPICPPDTALALNDVWPSMELRIPLAAGHSMYDPAITHELVKATDQFADILALTPERTTG
jgi:proline iminopeptidase